MFNVYIRTDDGEFLEGEYSIDSSALACIKGILRCTRHIISDIDLSRNPIIYYRNTSTGYTRKAAPIPPGALQNRYRKYSPEANTETIELLEKMLAGDGSSLQEFYRRYYPYVLKACKDAFKKYNITRQRHLMLLEPHDMASEVFFSLFRMSEKIKDVNDLQGYLTRLAWNKVLRYINDNVSSHKKMNAYVTDTFVECEDIRYTGAESEEIEKTLVGGIWSAMETLSKQQRQVFTLKYRDGLDYKDIMQAMGTTLENVKTHLYVARKNVREYLKAKGIEYAQ